MSEQPQPNPERELTAGQQFARWILEEMDKPVSPERQAAEARKEQEDRESMARFYRLTGQLDAPVAEAANTPADKPREPHAR